MIKIFVYKFNDDNADILLDKMSLLSSEERDRVCGYKFRKDRVLSLVGRLMLFSFCERFKSEEYKEINYINNPSEFTAEKMSDLKIEYSEIGKGRFAGREDIHFNISHSKDVCVLALSDSEVGIDIQYVKPINFRIAEKFFEKRDNEYINSFEKERTEKFIEVWCAKESYAKLTGNGISEGFSTFYENFDEMTVLDAKTGTKKAVLKKYEIDSEYRCLAACFE